MIPAFDENGQLPPGVHRATIEEVIRRFGHGSDEREACGQSLQWLLPICRRAGIIRVLINGSFVTDCRDPRDVDCVLVPGEDFMRDSDATFALHAGLPYLSLQIVTSDEEQEFFVHKLFATDRQGRSKGLVEIEL